MGEGGGIEVLTVKNTKSEILKAEEDVSCRPHSKFKPGERQLLSI